MENDQETQEVLDEMRAEGIDVDGTDSEPEEEEEKPADDPEKPEEGEEDSESEEEEDSDTEEEEADAPDEDDDSEEEEEDDAPQGKRIPLQKHQKLKKRWQDDLKSKDDEIATLKEKLESAAPDEEISSIAEEMGLDAETLAKLTKAISKKAFPKELVRKIEAYEASVQEVHSATAFRKEFDALAEKYPEVKDHKSSLRKLAFSEENVERPLTDIYFMDVKPKLTTKRRTAEPARGGIARKGGEMDIAAIKSDPEKMANLSDEEFDKLVEHEEKNKKSRIVRS